MTLEQLRQIRPDLAAQIAREDLGECLPSGTDRHQPVVSKRAEHEHDEQAALFRWAALNKRRLPELHWLYAIPNGGHRHPAVAAKMKVGDNTLTPAQRGWKAALEGFGYLVEVCYSWQTAAERLEWYLSANGKEGEVA